MAWSGLGAGTVGDPYQVDTAARLDEVRDYLSAYFIQTADIDLSAYGEWTPIAGVFSGSFDGNGYQIDGLTCTGSVAGIFAQVAGTVTSVGLTNINISVPLSGFAGPITPDCNGGVISKCFTTGSITVSSFISYIGGLVEYARNGATISNCYSLCTITTDISGRGGGLFGYADSSTITNCYFAGTITNTGANGAFIGIENACTITNCYFDSDISGQTSPVASGSGVGITGRTTTQMKYPTNLEYTDWDFNAVWGLDGYNNNSYPYLLLFPHYELYYELNKTAGNKVTVTVGLTYRGEFTPGLTAPGTYRLRFNQTVKSSGGIALKKVYDYEFTIV